MNIGTYQITRTSNGGRLYHDTQTGTDDIQSPGQIAANREFLVSQLHQAQQALTDEDALEDALIAEQG